jgi:CRP-like cAMP-binding protein
MISPELLRRYPFFCCLDDAQQKAVAMITEEISVPSGAVLFEEGQPATALYLLIEGSVDLYFTVPGEGPTKPGREFWVGEINPGEPFGISALIEPYRLTAMARVTGPSHILKIDGSALRALCEVDTHMAYALMRQIAKAALERLHATRVQMVGVRA